MFYICQLRKYVHDLAHVIVYESLEVEVGGLTYKEQPVRKVDQRVKQLRNKAITLVKVIWTHHGASKATWKTKDKMRHHYPHLFKRYVQHKFQGRKFL